MYRMTLAISLSLLGSVAAAQTLKPLAINSEQRVSTAQNYQYTNSFHSILGYSHEVLGRGEHGAKGFGSNVLTVVTGKVYDVHILASGQVESRTWRSVAADLEYRREQATFGTSFPVGPSMTFGLGVTNRRDVLLSGPNDHVEYNQYDFGFLYANDYMEAGATYKPKVETDSVELAAISSLHGRVSISKVLGLGLVLQHEGLSEFDKELKDRWSGVVAADLAFNKADRVEMKLGYKHHTYKHEETATDTMQKEALYGISYTHPWKNEGLAVSVFADGTSSVLNKNKGKRFLASSGLSLSAQL